MGGSELVGSIRHPQVKCLSGSEELALSTLDDPKSERFKLQHSTQVATEFHEGQAIFQNRAPTISRPHDGNRGTY